MFLIIFSCLFTVWLQDVDAVCPAIIKRKEWDANKPKYIKFLSVPVDLIIVQHTVTQTCSNDQSCLNIVKDIQKTHVDEAFLWDIGPSFLIANTGKIYEGRGWHHVAVHTYGYNNQSIGIAFIGNFNNQEPTVKALDAAKALIQCGIEEEYVTANHQLVIHSQLVSTDSPGKKLANKIRSWSNWKQDVAEIKKRADTQDVTNILVESRDAGDIAPSGKSRTKREILTTPKEIDLLSNSRDVIAELIDNLRDLAQQTLKTVVALSRGLARQGSMFLEEITSRLRSFKDRIISAVGRISLIPGFEKCTKPIQDRANIFYDNIEAKTKTCVDKRVNEIDNMIKNLGTISNNAINFTKTAVEETRNCTELNYGIESTTKACLNSVTSQTRTASDTFDAQKTIALDTIKSALDALPAALDLCARKQLLDADAETAQVVSQITRCSPSFGNFFGNW